MIDSAWNRGLHLAAPAPKRGCCFKPPPTDYSPALSKALLPSPRINRAPPHNLHLCPPQTSPAIAPFEKLDASPNPRPRAISSHVLLSHAARPRRHTHFVTDLSLFRSANVTRPARILQANRVVALASYLLSFKPFHTISAPSSPQAQQPRPLQRLRCAFRPRLDSTRFNSGLALVPRPSDSLPHTLTTSAALFLSPARPHTTPCLLRTTRFATYNILPSCRRSSPQTKCWLRTRTSTHLLQLNHVRLRTLRQPGHWIQLHYPRECCSLVRGVPSANRDAWSCAPKSGDH